MKGMKALGKIKGSIAYQYAMDTNLAVNGWL